MNTQKNDKIDIIHIDRNGYNSIYCLDDCIATIAHKENLDYQLIYLDMHKITYDYKVALKNNKVISGLCSTKQEDNTYVYLQKYHGIMIKDYFELTKDEVLIKIENELANGKCVLVRLDSYYCDWDVLYQKEHTKHLGLCIGLDIDNVILCDPFYGLNNIKMNIQAFIDANHGRISTYDIKIGSSKLDEFCKNKILSTCFESQIFEYRLNSISKIACAYGEIFKFETEYNDFDEALESFDAILDILIRTSKFYNLLKYLKPVDGNIQAIMNEVIGSWVVVKNTLFKGFFKHKDDTGIKLKKRILEILENEKKIYNYYCQGEACRVDNIIGDNILSELKYKSLEIGKSVLFDSIDISKLLNNNSFGDYRNDRCEADFTGLNEFLQVNGNESYLQINDTIKVKTYICSNNMCDNVVCEGQKIEIYKDKLYSRIGFIAVSEFGESIDVIKVIYDDGKQQKLHIKISDVNNEPLFEEKTIWRGVTYQKVNNGNMSIRLENAHLYWVEYRINNDNSIKRIILPECSNLHIYGIYFFE
ncbi:MAG: hypothetical protein HFG39_12160 [Lachnospiraceae bacterium]|nr:hypothetical protein [Lachnospiraceae bacterium]